MSAKVSSVIIRSIGLILDPDLRFDRKVRRGWGDTAQDVPFCVDYLDVRNAGWSARGSDGWRIGVSGYLRKKDGTVGKTRVTDREMPWGALSEPVQRAVLGYLDEQQMPPIPEEWRSA